MNGKWQVSTEGVDFAPMWNPNGKELYFVENGSLMKVDVTAQPNISFLPPQKVLALPESLVSIHDTSRDGDKFLVTLAAKSDVKANQLTIVLGWFSELRQKFSSIKKIMEARESSHAYVVRASRPLRIVSALSGLRARRSHHIFSQLLCNYMEK